MSSAVRKSTAERPCTGPYKNKNQDRSRVRREGRKTGDGRQEPDQERGEETRRQGLVDKYMHLFAHTHIHAHIKLKETTYDFKQLEASNQVGSVCVCVSECVCVCITCVQTPVHFVQVLGVAPGAV